MSSDSSKSILLIGNYRPTLQVAATFKKLGFHVIVARDCGGGFAQFSRNVDECWDHPDLADEEKFFKALKEFLTDREDITHIYPIWERFQKSLMIHRNELPDRVLVVSVENKTLNDCLDKPKMMALTDAAGVLQARYEKVSGLQALQTAIEKIGFPMIIRPASSDHRLLGKKALIAEQPSEIAELLETWPGEHEMLLVQEFVKGMRINLYFAASAGNPIRYLATEIEETDELDGTGFAILGKTVDLTDELKAIGDRLIGELNFHGIGLLQFIREETSGQLFFIELNPRVSGSHAVPESCGMDLGELSLRLASGQSVPDHLVVGAAGKRYVWTYGALRRALKSYQAGDLPFFSTLKALVAAAFSAIKADIHLTFDRRDPMPAIAEFLYRAPVVSLPIERFAKTAKRSNRRFLMDGKVK